VFKHLPYVIQSYVTDDVSDYRISISRKVNLPKILKHFTETKKEFEQCCTYVLQAWLPCFRLYRAKTVRSICHLRNRRVRKLTARFRY